MDFSLQKKDIPTLLIFTAAAIMSHISSFMRSKRKQENKLVPMCPQIKKRGREKITISKREKDAATSVHAAAAYTNNIFRNCAIAFLPAIIKAG